MKIIDSHAHLEMAEFDGDRAAISSARRPLPTIRIIA